jgi:hypothetical protein
MPTTASTLRLFAVRVTRKDRATLPAGAAVGFGYTLQASDALRADILAAERLARHADADLLFIERIEDVTPPVSRY